MWQGVEFILPTDVIIADKFAPDANTKTVPISEIPDGWMVQPRLQSSHGSKIGGML